MSWLNAFKIRLNTLAIVLIPVCIGINWAGRSIDKALNLPIFLDSIGTVLGGLLAGPWVGAISGFVANFINAGTVDPIAAWYSIVSIGIGFAAGIAGYLGWQKRLPAGWIGLWILIFLVASIISTPINIGLFGGQSGVWFGDGIYTALVKGGMPTWIASYLDEASVDIIDKLIAVLVAILIYQGLPSRYRSLFRMYHPATDRGESKSAARA
jgi:energy-coupling factor transport system substrate-specific component